MKKIVVKTKSTSVIKVTLCLGVLVGLFSAVLAITHGPFRPARAATTYTVTTNADAGAGSLRQAILDANANAGADVINFDAAYSIQILSSLPTITEQVEINGYTGSPGGATANSAVSPAPFNGTLTIEIDGTNIALDGGDCLRLDGASNSVIKGLVINNCGNDGISVERSNYVTIAGNYIGTDTTGLVDAGNGRNEVGSSIAMGVNAYASNHMTIGGTSPAERNIIAGNQAGDIFINNEGNDVNPSEYNTIIGNYIGLGKDGTTPLPSGFADGLGNAILLGNSHHDQIGGTTEGTKNVIGSSDEYGVGFRDGSSHTVIEGNYIGTDYTGNAGLTHALGTGNISAGVHVGSVSSIFTRPVHDITVGGTTSASRNVISGNSNSAGGVTSGVNVDDGAYNTVVSGNYIGIAADGTTDLGNEGNGMQIGTVGGAGDSSSHDNTIGGDTAGERNVISGNGENGIGFYGEVSDITISGNYIGLDATGNANQGNDQSGISMNHSSVVSERITIGGDSEGERNVISANDNNGINLQGDNVKDITVSGNYIGINADGIASIGNNFFGIYILDAAHDIIIGGDSAGERNVISGNNVNDGVKLLSAGSNNIISGNYIGTNAAGTAAIGNNTSGVHVEDTSNVLIGGDTAGERNVISGNANNGVYIKSAGSDNVVSGNYIGLDRAGTSAIANERTGVLIEDTSNVLVGGDSAGERNVISGNTERGVEINFIGGNSDNNIISGNYIGTDYSGMTAVGNGSIGLNVGPGHTGNIIGGDTAGERNVISGNSENGVILGDGSILQGNYIGLKSDGSAVLPNAISGIMGNVVLLGSNNIVGGTTAGARNYIAGGPQDGIQIIGLTPFGGTPANNNIVQGNCIGTNANCEYEAGFGNPEEGILLILEANNNQIGGTSPGSGNVIAGNGAGIVNAGVFGFYPINNSFLGNRIFNNGGGTRSTIGIDNLETNDFASWISQNVTPNDPNDEDANGDNTGPNHYLNFPVLKSVTSADGTATITYDLDINDTEASSTGYRVEFFASDDADPSGHGQGQYYLGSDTIGANDVTARQATITLPAGISGSKHISAVTTMIDDSEDGFGHSSEFAENVQASLVAKVASPDDSQSGISSLLANTGQNIKLISIAAFLLITTGAITLAWRKKAATSHTVK